MTREELREHCIREIDWFEKFGYKKVMNCFDKKRYEEHKLVLELLDQEPKIGHWIYRTSDDYLGELNRYYECSECGRTVGDAVGDIYTEYPYCHCGAKMVKDGEK